jgi:hypothetical protein
VFGRGSITLVDATRRELRGSVVAGLGFRSVRLQQSENFECLQVRLSPLVARAVLGVSPADMEGSVVALEDLWGRTGSRICERLGGASSRENRFTMRTHSSMPSVRPDGSSTRRWPEHGGG